MHALINANPRPVDKILNPINAIAKFLKNITT